MSDDSAGPDALRAEFERRKTAIREMPDPGEALDAAGKLVTESAEFRGEAATLRTEQAERLRAAESLSVQQLADRLHVAKGTAQKILEREKRTEREREKKRRGDGE